ncbi:MAG: hypothetical protein LBI04_12060 [Treponema sp.]|jgi:hypothetical protein|nr:hypothetical protein [Treponema sp.]
MIRTFENSDWYSAMPLPQLKTLCIFPAPFRARFLEVLFALYFTFPHFSCHTFSTLPLFFVKINTFLHPIFLAVFTESWYAMNNYVKALRSMLPGF